MERGLPGHGALQNFAKFEYKFTRFLIGISLFLALISSIANGLPWYSAVLKFSLILLVGGILFSKALFFRIWLQEVDFLGLAFTLLLQGITVIGLLLALASWLYTNLPILPSVPENPYLVNPELSEYYATKYLWRRVLVVGIIYGIYSSISFILLGKFIREVYVVETVQKEICEIMPASNEDDNFDELGARLTETH